MPERGSDGKPLAYGEVIVEREIEAVFAYLADGEALTQWMPEEFAQVEKLSPGLVGAGTAYRYVLRRSKVESVLRWDEYEPPRRLSWTGVPVRSLVPFSRMTPRGSYALEEVPSGTLVRATIDPKLTGVLRLARRVGTKSTAQTWREQLERLKRILEAGDAGSPRP